MHGQVLKRHCRALWLPLDRLTHQLLRRRAAADARIQPPILAVENHPSCRTNARGEPLLPNDQAWRPELVLTLLVSRLLSQANAALDMPVSDPTSARMGSGSRCADLVQARQVGAACVITRLLLALRLLSLDMHI